MDATRFEHTAERVMDLTPAQESELLNLIIGWISAEGGSQYDDLRAYVAKEVKRMDPQSIL